MLNALEFQRSPRQIAQRCAVKYPPGAVTLLRHALAVWSVPPLARRGCARQTVSASRYHGDGQPEIIFSPDLSSSAVRTIEGLKEAPGSSSSVFTITSLEFFSLRSLTLAECSSPPPPFFFFSFTLSGEKDLLWQLRRRGRRAGAQEEQWWEGK